MNDLAALGTFFACLIATLGLIRACEWLLPATPRPAQDHAKSESGTRAADPEARR